MDTNKARYERLKFEYYLKHGMQGSKWAYFAYWANTDRRPVRLNNPWAREF